MQQKNNDTDLNNFYNIALNHVQKHGLSFLLLMLMVFWFNNQYIKLSEKIDQCNQATIEMYQNQSNELIEVLKDNSKAMENISRHLDRE